MTLPTIKIKKGTGTPSSLEYGELATNTNSELYVGSNAASVVKISAKHNFIATTDPAATDDSGEGYTIGSRWYNLTNDTIWDCIDSTVDAAVWRIGTLSDGDVPLDLYINILEPTTPTEADVWLFDEPTSLQTVIKYRDSGGNNQTVATMNRIVVAKDATETITLSESGHFLTNEGAAGTVIITLPTAVAGYTYTFYIQTAQTFTITANLSDTIRNGSSVSATNGTISAATVGNLVTITAINATEWVVSEIVGTWTVT